MGKTARWFRGLLTGKSKESKPEEKKKRWSFVRSSKSNDCTHTRQPPPPPPPPSASADLRRGSYRDVVSATPIHGYSFDGGGGGGGGSSGVGVDPNKHAIAVAAATAAVAEAAVAAAQAAAAVVKLTSSGRSAAARGGGEAKRWDDWAAVVIQSAFRGYLAKRALRALKGLVKLQALVRGHIMRKKTVDTMRRMQALVRVQARARAGRSKSTERRYLNKQLSHSHLPGPATPEKYEHAIRSNSTRYDRSSSSLKRNGSKGHRDVYELDRVHSSRNYGEHCVDERQLNHLRRRESLMRTGLQEDEKSDKIVEIDPGKPQLDLRRGTTTSQSSQRSLGQDRLSHSFTTMDSPSKDSTTAQLSTSSASSGEVQSMHPRRFPLHIEDDQFCTAENSPQFYSVSSRATSVRRSPFTPAKSDCSGSLFSGYSDHPNYMSNTESSRAKVRSQSAPKQRLEFEKSSSTKRSYIQGFNDVRSSSVPKTTAALQANFARKAYPGSGRLDRLGMPIVHSETIGSFNGT